MIRLDDVTIQFYCPQLKSDSTYNSRWLQRSKWSEY